MKFVPCGCLVEFAWAEIQIKWNESGFNALCGDARMTIQRIKRIISIQNIPIIQRKISEL